MSWIVAGLIGGVGAFLADWFMWSKVFKGMEQYGTAPASPQEVKKMMAANLPKSAVLALAFGVLLAWFYGRLKSGLWVQGGARSPAWSSPPFSGSRRSRSRPSAAACGSTKFGACTRRPSGCGWAG